LLLQSQGFDSPRDAALTIARLQKEGAPALAALQDQVVAAPGITASELDAALQFFAATGA
jgi:tryptophanyl-tRNA synthetase